MHKISNLQSMETLINIQYATGKQQSAYMCFLKDSNTITSLQKSWQ